MVHKQVIYVINVHINLIQNMYLDQTHVNVDKVMYKYVILVSQLVELMVLMILQNVVLVLILIKIVECA